MGPVSSRGDSGKWKEQGRTKCSIGNITSSPRTVGPLLGWSMAWFNTLPTRDFLSLNLPSPSMMESRAPPTLFPSLLPQDAPCYRWVMSPQERLIVQYCFHVQSSGLRLQGRVSSHSPIL